MQQHSPPLHATYATYEQVPTQAYSTPKRSTQSMNMNADYITTS
jgi:hypothetical protein